ncbi:DUF4349 domain-containing protein [Aquimarina sp. AD10]|uniref:DUF4349 domain-containing protein n=1 Tax=Aquimarina sp. AD10 TaxID=1714849 RepID=UPI000E5531F0|nr:DUF4349 domain-containing protein [Aquimarina sp. AD10]AXT62869.1 DUF4349 domain-containing protein [Aquimarina sp. AD10]RKM94237.1 DUF4349 domain-containing protein [Aquimarina sp. AD10]
MKSNKISKVGIVMLVVILLLSISCSKESKLNDIALENIPLKTTGEQPVLNSFETNDDREANKIGVDRRLKIIKNATSKIKVKNVEKATQLAKNTARKYDGYVSDERFTNTNTTKENRFTIRIPQDHFDTVLNQICELSEFVEYKNVSTIDVTEEYIDISSRLKTKLEVKQRYENILRTSAKTVEDILLAEDKLNELQEEIESAQARLNYLGNKVSYSTIQLDMYETVIPKKEPETYEPGFFDNAQEGLSFGWSLIKGLILIVFYIWPLIVLGLIILVYFRIIRNRKILN